MTDIQYRNNTLDNLPLLVLEKLITYLNFKEVSDLRILSKYFDYLCKTFLRKSTKKVKKQILKEGLKYKKDLPSHTSLKENNKFLLKYYVVQLLNNEINTILSKQRLFLRYYVPGRLLDYMKNILNCIQNELIEPKSIINAYKIFFNTNKKYFEKQFSHFTSSPSFGNNFMNFLHIMKGLKYVVDVTYDKIFHTCYIDGEYNVENFQVSHFLLLLLTRPFVEKDYLLNNEEKITLLKLLFLIVEYHNNFYIHRNVYEKIIHKPENRVSNEPNTGEIFNEHSACYRRLILKERILEKYKNVKNRTHLSNNGLNCKIKFKCSTKDAPYNITKFWNKLILSQLIQSKGINIDKSYSFHLNFQVNIPTSSGSYNFFEGLIEEKLQT